MMFPLSLRALLRLTISTLLVIAAALARAAEGDGTIAGQVIDMATAAPVEGVTVSVIGGAQPETRVTGADGSWEVTGLPPGSYVIRFEKPGFKPAVINRFAVRPAETSRADLSLSPLPPDEPAMPSDVEEFVVVGTKAEAIEASRESSDQLLNTLSAEEFSKFAASDVADALKFVPGVNVVKGQFAIIRGLEDRYSSTTYNGAPVPSPDPDRQSVQLDLFPSEVVTNLVVAKTFAPELPSNSSGGSINIITHDYPEDVEAKLTTGVGINSNARDEFIHFDKGSSVGRVDNGYGEVLDSEFGVSLAGRSSLRERETRFKLVLNRSVESETATGVTEKREPKAKTTQPVGFLSNGELNLSDGRYETVSSYEDSQLLGYLGMGIDIDPTGSHKLDLSAFYTQKEEDAVDTKANGTIPHFDYSIFETATPTAAEFNCCATLLSWITRPRENLDDAPSRGALWYTNFGQSTAIDRDRDLLVTQLNGDHTLEALDGLHLSWTGNYAKTTQDEVALSTRIFFEPADPFAIPDQVPTSVSNLLPGRFAAPKNGILFSATDVAERQYFFRFDGDYTRDVTDWASLKLNVAGWYEDAKRDVTASFLQTPGVNPAVCQPAGTCVGTTSQFVTLGDTPNELGHSTFDTLLRGPDGDYDTQRDGTSDALREIMAAGAGLKATLFEDLDLLGGARLERILIETNHSPYTGEIRNGAPATFPEVYLFFDRPDNNVTRTEFFLPGPYNDEILGLNLPRNPATGFVDLLTRAEIDAVINGEIDETRVLPAFGLAYRPIEGLALRGAYSQTVARPSFRELGFYVSLEPGTDDQVVGNPQLQLSDVESYDVRGEYTWGDVGDLAALSLFYKRIDDPIESIVIRNPLIFDDTSALYRTFFNNPNVARLWGVELEGRKNLELIPLDFARYFSVGANFTYIDAKVGRTQAELQRATNFFGGVANPSFSGMKESRRLFGQPEWIANADLSFDQPDWGTKMTLAFFAISDILDSAGSANVGPTGQIETITLDRYTDSFSRLDLIVSQSVFVDFLDCDVVFKISGKNLTDTTRRLIYDPDQTKTRYAEREFKLGREFKFTMTFAF